MESSSVHKNYWKRVNLKKIIIIFVEINYFSPKSNTIVCKYKIKNCSSNVYRFVTKNIVFLLYTKIYQSLLINKLEQNNLYKLFQKLHNPLNKL